MSECRSCQKPLTEQDAFCPFCGYDPKTDTINPSFKLQPAAPPKKIKIKKHAPPGSGLNPKVKMFAVAGVVVLIFSVFYKYNFNVTLVVAKMNQVLRLKPQNPPSQKEKVKDAPKEEKKEVRLEWSDVKDFEPPAKDGDYKALVVEGIFFDPAAKSYVTINGQVVEEGTDVRGATVKKINKDSVDLLVDGQQKSVSVNESIPFPDTK